jgi:hypothetical protein
MKSSGPICGLPNPHLMRKTNRELGDALSLLDRGRLSYALHRFNSTLRGSLGGIAFATGRRLAHYSP